MLVDCTQYKPLQSKIAGVNAGCQKDYSDAALHLVCHLATKSVKTCRNQAILEAPLTANKGPLRQSIEPCKGPAKELTKACVIA